MSKQNKKVIRDFIQEHGYSRELHTLQTEDGYVLSLDRLHSPEMQKNPHAVSDCGTKIVKPSGKMQKPVALLVHAYKLLDEGYDVWLANMRGSSKESRGHASLSPKSKSYWNFSFHEMGIFDLPAIVNYILETTGEDSLSYIGHSKPEYCSKVKIMISLAPAVYGAHIRNPFFKSLLPICHFIVRPRVVVNVCKELQNVLKQLQGKSKFLRNREICDKAASQTIKYIAPPSKREAFGALIIKLVGGCLGGFGKTGIEKNRLRSFSSEWPAPSSIKLFCHGSQCYQTNKIRQYNYGTSGNVKMYGQPKPPAYDFKKISIPVATFCSEGDELCRPEDVLRLSKYLPNSIGHYYIQDATFSHMDFMVGKDAHEFVYKKFLRILDYYKDGKEITKL